MKRSALQRSAPMIRQRKRRKAVAMRAVPKRLGASKVKKGPARNDVHLAKVRAERCLVCVKFGLTQKTPTHAHHCRAVNGSMLGKRPSDFLTTPLCAEHHLDQFPAGLHRFGEKQFWRWTGIDPREWIAAFSPEGAAELARLEQQSERAR